MARKEKQLERSKESHLKEVEMMNEESREYKERMVAHEASIKQIFDECLNNKDKIIGEMKLQHTTQLAEEKRLLEEKKAELKEVNGKLKEN